METVEAIYKRRSVRRFVGKTDGDDLKTILACGNEAPSSGGTQPWEFILITDKHLIVSLAKMAADSARHFYKHILKADIPDVKLDEICNGLIENFAKPDIIVVVSKISQEWMTSTFCSVQNILLSATSLGYGAQVISLMGDEREVEEALNLPKTYRYASILRIGKSAQGEPQPRTLPYKPVEEKIHENQITHP